MGQNLGVLPSEQTRHVGVAKSEHPRLTKFSKNSNLCDHNSPTLQTDGGTDGRTDGQTTCDRNTALCTKVHRAVQKQTYVKTEACNSILEYFEYFCQMSSKSILI